MSKSVRSLRMSVSKTENNLKINLHKKTLWEKNVGQWRFKYIFKFRTFQLYLYEKLKFKVTAVSSLC